MLKKKAWMVDARELDHPGWFTTYTGRPINLDKFSVNDIDIDEVAHHLSLLCRYGGHCREFYSVAQHAVLVAEWLRDRGEPIDVVYTGLHHDDTEAYLGDVIRPLKKLLPGYQQIEDRFAATLADKFGTIWPLPTVVKEADMAVFRQECEDIRWKDVQRLDPIVPASPSAAKSDYLYLHDYLRRMLTRR